MTTLAYESHSLTPDRHRLDAIERIALGILTLGLLAMLAGLLFAKATTPEVFTQRLWNALVVADGVAVPAATLTLRPLEYAVHEFHPTIDCVAVT